MFNPQKMDVDEHIDLIDTLGNMLGQKDKSKKDKFIDTMATIIQTHLITKKDWAATTKKAKELEHIIRKCDPLAAALPTLAKGTAVPSLYSHVAHSNDKDEAEIPQPFKGLVLNNPSLEVEAKVNNLNKNQKIHHHKHKMINIIMRTLTTINIMRIIGANPEVVDPIEAKIQDVPLEAKISMAEVKEIRTHTKANIKMMAIKAIITRVIKDFIIIHIKISLKVIAMDNLEVEAMAEAEAITVVMVMIGPIIEAMLIINIISIMVMMMSTVHHVLYVLAIFTLPNIVLKESTTSMTLWKR